MLKIAITTTIALFVALAAMPVASATDPPGNECSGRIATNCWVCSDGASWHCYWDIFSAHWVHCQVYVASGLGNGCVIGG